MPSLTPAVPIHLDKDRTLRLDFRAVFSAEQELTRLWGKETTFYSAMWPLVQALSEGSVLRLNLTNLAVLLWVGCRGEDPTLTLAQVQEALPYRDPVALIPLCAALLEAWNLVNPTEQTPPQEGTSEADPLGGSTGAPSGALVGLNSA